MMADRLIHQHWQRQNMLLHSTDTRYVQLVIDVAESLSFNDKIAWVFESRTQFFTINGAALM